MSEIERIGYTDGMSTTPAAADPGPQLIDVTGLTPDAVKAVEGLVRAFRGQPLTASPNGRVSPVGPPPNETAVEWVARFTAHCMSQKPVTWFVDDSRESIYEGCGE